MPNFKTLLIYILLFTFLVISLQYDTEDASTTLRPDTENESSLTVPGGENSEEPEPQIKKITEDLPSDTKKTTARTITPEKFQEMVQEKVNSFNETPPPQSSTKTPTTADTPEKKESEPTISFAEINTNTRKALVNIFCTTKRGGSLNPISGSGVIIDGRGVILTNAHVAQYFLLKDYSSEGYITCIARTGSPAKPTYKLEPLYISASWVVDNASKITAENALGTGQYDYALLAITETVSGTPVETPLPHVKLSKRADFSAGDAIYIGGYPAGFIGGITVQKNLNITSTLGNIEDIFTFVDGTPDLITVRGSILSQEGASGGAVVDKHGDLLAVVVTSSIADNTSMRTLGAITTEYIDRDFESQVGVGLDDFLLYDIAGTIESFWRDVAPTLTNLLYEVLNR